MSKNAKRQQTLDEMITTSSKKTKTNQTTSTIEKKISNEDLEILKQFDLDMIFGPCTGISRIDRYERALRHELDPPIRVYELIQLYPNDRQVTYR